MRETMPGKAFILAAGLGTRLLPLTRETPKPLLPIWHVPNLERVLAMLRRWGVREVLINLHHRADRLFDHVRTRPADGLRIALSYEPVILGTGGALRKAEWFFDGPEPVWVLNADVVAELAPERLLKAYDPRRTMAVAWLHGSRGPRTVEVFRGGITNFRSKRAGTPGTFTFCGLQLVNPKLLDREAEFLPKEAVFGTVVAAYERALAAGWRVAGVEVPGSYWADIGTPAQYLQCHRELCPYGMISFVKGAHRARLQPAPHETVAALYERRLQSSAPSRRRPRRDVHQEKPYADFSAVHPQAVVQAGAQISHSVVGARAQVGPKARIVNAVVAADSVVNGPVSYLALPAVQAFDRPALELLQGAGWTPERCTALPFGPRGSARTFTRVALGSKTALLVQYDPARTENTWYVLHARFLRRLGLPVPQVLADDPDQHVSLFEDLGDRSVEAEFGALSEARRESLYRAVLEVMVRWHEEGGRAARREKLPLMPSFRPVLYHWERAYFAEHMLRKRCGLSPREAAVIQRELAGMGRALTGAPPVLVHRDLQSSNVLLRGGKPWLIDFQGMRFGPAVYDLASLLCDPYVQLADDLRERLLEYYAERSAHPALVRELFWRGAVQRLSQALGAYARLGAQRDTAAFARHIPAALGLMRTALDRVPGCPRLRAWSREAG